MAVSQRYKVLLFMLFDWFRAFLCASLLVTMMVCMEIEYSVVATDISLVGMSHLTPYSTRNCICVGYQTQTMRRQIKHEVDMPYTNPTLAYIIQTLFNTRHVGMATSNARVGGPQQWEPPMWTC